MTDVLVDSNVILDVLTEDPQWFEWSAQTLVTYADRGMLVVNPLIYAEISIGLNPIEELEAALPNDFFRRGLLPYEAAFLAGQSFLAAAGGGQSTLLCPTFTLVLMLPLPECHYSPEMSIATVPTFQPYNSSLPSCSLPKFYRNFRSNGRFYEH